MPVNSWKCVTLLANVPGISFAQVSCGRMQDRLVLHHLHHAFGVELLFCGRHGDSVTATNVETFCCFSSIILTLRRNAVCTSINKWTDKCFPTCMKTQNAWRPAELIHVQTQTRSQVFFMFRLSGSVNRAEVTAESLKYFLWRIKFKQAVKSRPWKWPFTLERALN